MSDRELLELAARAAGLPFDEGVYDELMGLRLGNYGMHGDEWWHPLDDDGDAFRLAVKLGIDVCIGNGNDMDGGSTNCCVFSGPGIDDAILDASEMHGSDPYAATRRAIVRAAAEIGKAK